MEEFCPECGAILLKQNDAVICTCCGNYFECRCEECTGK